MPQETPVDDARPKADDAPGRTARKLDFGGFQVVGRTVTIAADPAVIQSHFRDLSRFGRLLGPQLKVQEAPGDLVVWTLDTGGDPIRVESTLIHDREGELCAWRSTKGSDFDVEIKVQLRPAPAGRGTEVEAHVAWHPHWGIAGQIGARLRGIDPKSQCAHVLKRLKMLLETGEIATAQNRRTI